jgi:hypothetical protein
MDGLVGAEGAALPVCPECGWGAKRRGQFFRARRRKWWAFVAIVLALGAAASGLTPKVRRDGVWSVTPTWVMWAILRSGRVPSDAFTVELAKRADGYEECVAAAERAYRLAPSARLTRQRGVKGVPLRARNGSILGHSWQTTGFTFSPEGWLTNDADVDAVQSHEDWWMPGTRVLRPSPASKGDTSVLVTRLYCRSRTADPSNGHVNFDWSIPLAESLDDVMTPVAVAREKLVAALHPTVFVLPTTKNLALSVRDVSEGDVGGALALGMRVDVVRRGEVVAYGRWYQSTDGTGVSGRPVLVRFGPYDPVHNVNGPMTSTLEELIADGCVVRFGTDEEMALAAIGSERYWRGSFEVPLKELVK